MFTVICVHTVQDADTVNDAIKMLTERGCIQPVLFSYQQQHWIKLDNTAVVVNLSCVADLFQLLLQYFFVMNVSYPPELWLVYGFLEKVMKVTSTVGKSVRLAEFCQHVFQQSI